MTRTDFPNEARRARTAEDQVFDLMRLGDAGDVRVFMFDVDGDCDDVFDEAIQETGASFYGMNLTTITVGKLRR